MHVPSRVVAFVIVTAWLCPKSYAPIYGGYPGLSSLIKQAEVIAAVTILEQLSDEDFGGSARYKVQFDKVLKGKAPEKQSVVYLRYLEIIPEPELRRSPPPQPPPSIQYFAPTDRINPFSDRSRWIVFLTKAPEGVKAVYENVNCAGSTFPLSPLRDLDALRIEPLPETLIFLCREYVEFKRKDFKEVEEQMNTFIHRRDG